MNFKFHNKKISGILTITPKNEVRFEDEMHNYNFTSEQSIRLKKVMGFEKKRIVENDTICSSDLCKHGLEYLFNTNKLKKDDIDALILVTQSPDYIMPPTSNVLHGHFNLKKETICMDINQGCAGYIVGLMQAFLLLEQSSINKVVLLNADVLSPKVSKSDRNSNPIIGDAASITIVEKSFENNTVEGMIKMNGQGAFSLHIPAGGCKLPVSEETSKMEIDFEGNYRSKNNLIMKGDEVYNFVMTEIPTLINDVLDFTSNKKDDIDFFIFHQPNKFILNKLSDKIGVDSSKLFSNIVENFGNASGVSVPTTICYNLGSNILNNEYLVCMAGFGVGLTWGSFIMKLGNLEFCEIIDY